MGVAIHQPRWQLNDKWILKAELPPGAVARTLRRECNIWPVKVAGYPVLHPKLPEQGEIFPVEYCNHAAWKLASGDSPLKVPVSSQGVNNGHELPDHFIHPGRKLRLHIAAFNPGLIAKHKNTPHSFCEFSFFSPRRLCMRRACFPCP